VLLIISLNGVIFGTAFAIFDVITILFFVVLSLSYAVVVTRSLTHGPIAWRIDRIERRGDLFGVLAAVLAFSSGALAIAKDFIEHGSKH
jgi:hypothetical protein